MEHFGFGIVFSLRWPRIAWRCSTRPRGLVRHSFCFPEDRDLANEDKQFFLGTIARCPRAREGTGRETGALSMGTWTLLGSVDHFIRQPEHPNVLCPYRFPQCLVQSGFEPCLPLPTCWRPPKDSLMSSKTALMNRIDVVRWMGGLLALFAVVVAITAMGIEPYLEA